MIESGTGRAKITDFGLARTETGPSTLSREGFLAGTPTYMSPEQARGDAQVDARADVYGLGATLYQALTGVTPYRGGPHLVLRQVIEADPLPPRRLNDQVPRDLETICLKAMAKEPARRYPSADALAGDLRHWLNGEPILARPVGLLERAYRWVPPQPASRRAGGGFGLRLHGRVSRRLLAMATRRENLKESQISFRTCRRGAVDQFYTRFYEQGVLNVPGLEKVRRDVLGEMIRYYKDFLDQHRNDPALRRELAETCQRIGNLTKDLGNKVDALAVLREAVQYFDRLPADLVDDPSIQTRLYVSLDYIAQLESDLGEIESARRNYQRRALGIIEKMVPREPGNLRRRTGWPSFWETMPTCPSRRTTRSRRVGATSRHCEIQKDLVRQDPAQLDFKNDLALTYFNLAVLEKSPQENRALLEQALTLRKELVEVNPGNAVFRRHLGRTYDSLGQNSYRSGTRRRP